MLDVSILLVCSLPRLPLIKWKEHVREGISLTGYRVDIDIYLMSWHQAKEMLRCRVRMPHAYLYRKKLAVTSTYMKSILTYLYQLHISL